eukprot:CAMPEP_0201486138 /NCGR_PEP_ID=MMETSP0151_2-20130828/10203_1 /ASSEMBLY_ACC=CAM_ASM_000257 /TAXON_ID=200890 /ORGANISM="Paramoeba atlantica, Strain 621/1 / CCAP 1560/9" /LENGTH=180 /DNA_ID=CAMNT_0047870601 /DNA_START=17 /DNA_END=556 /DNA_ORIENTATION=+
MSMTHLNIFDGGGCRPCRRDCHHTKVDSEWKSVFVNFRGGQEAIVPYDQLQHFIQTVKSITECHKLLHDSLKGIVWQSEASFHDLCLLSSFSFPTMANITKVGNFTQVGNKTYESPIFRMLSSPLTRGLRAWDLEDRCKLYPITCQPEQKKGDEKPNNESKRRLLTKVPPPKKPPKKPPK